MYTIGEVILKEQLENYVMLGKTKSVSKRHQKGEGEDKAGKTG